MFNLSIINLLNYVSKHETTLPFLLLRYNTQNYNQPHINLRSHYQTQKSLTVKKKGPVIFVTWLHQLNKDFSFEHFESFNGKKKRFNMCVFCCALP